MRILVALWLTFAADVQVGLGTVFGPSSTDPGNPRDRLGCIGRRIRVTDEVVAHKTMACGTRLHLCVPRTGRCADTVVADWGPVHAAIDLSVGLARRLKHNGYELVTWTILP